jgi:hypothetical protein
MKALQAIGVGPRSFIPVCNPKAATASILLERPRRDQILQFEISSLAFPDANRASGRAATRVVERLPQRNRHLSDFVLEFLNFVYRMPFAAIARTWWKVHGPSWSEHRA